MEIKSLASGSSGNCYWISDGESPLLIEAGISIKKIKEKLNYKLHEVDGCLCSHEHGDHSKSIKELCQAGINCYMSPGTAEKVGYHNHRVTPISVLEPIGNWNVKPFDCQHDAAEPIGFLIQNQKTNEQLLYLTDSIYSKFRFHGLNYIMLEVNFCKEILNKNVSKGIISPARKNRVIRSHMGLETAKEFLRANDLSQVREIWLLHLSDRNSNAEQFKKEIQQITGRPVKVAE